MDAVKLERERQEYKAAERHEARAAECLARGNREAWEHFAGLADLCWQGNVRAVEQLDRLTA